MVIMDCLSNGMSLLLKDIQFDEKYDKDLDNYSKMLAYYVDRYDYQSVIEAFISSARKALYRGGIADKYVFMRSLMIKSEPSMKPKLTEEEYIAKEKADMEAWLSMVGPKWRLSTEKELSVSPLTKDMPKRYQHYNLGYLTRVAEEHKCSINHLCEIAGLIPEQLIG
jgi:hypothetical protein